MVDFCGETRVLDHRSESDERTEFRVWSEERYLQSGNESVDA